MCAVRPTTIHVNGADGDGDALRRLITQAVRKLLLGEGVSGGEVSVTLLSDEAIGAMHGKYLGSDSPTDVIAFALHDEGEEILGDVYVGRQQALRQARERSVDHRMELARLAVHGVLHVLGHNHPKDARREDSPMFRIQESVMEGIRW